VTRAIAPSSTLTDIRRLRGGISSHMHALTLRSPAGARRRLVLRRYREETGDGPATASLEWRLLSELRDSPVPAPQPIWADFDGTVLGQPAIITEFLPGRPLVAPRELDAWTRQLAETLAGIHALPVTRFDFLPLWDMDRDRWMRTPEVAERTLTGMGIDGPRAVASLKTGPASLPSKSPSVLHWDYWPGNTLWTRRRLTGVVDWAMASLGNARYDVAYCRLDMSLFFGAEAAGLFTRAYRDAAGHTLEDLPYWDLFASLRALLEVGEWGLPYESLGKRDVPGSLVLTRLREFVGRALREAR
jgi:aminoglycoside phosphotransferase (APT) family kinase protein